MNNSEYVPYNIFEKVVSDITPEEFEIFCKTVLQEYAIRDKLNEFSITQNIKIKNNNETYQIDVYADFIALNVKFNVIVECKHQKRSVERDEVILLNEKVHNLGAHKGILISTSGFQSGAISRAGENGIALIQVIDKSFMFIKASLKNINEYEMEFQRQYPPYLALQYSGTSEFPSIKLYPTEKIEDELKEKIKSMFNI